MCSTIDILDYSIYAGSKLVLVDGVSGVIDTINPHSYIIARKDKEFQEALRSADYLLPDGVGIQIASRVLTGRRIEKIAGADLHEVIVNSLDRKGGSCFYLGSSEETLRLIKDKLSVNHPTIRVGTFSPPYKSTFDEEDNRAMIEAVNSFSPNVLFVGMTAPKQEKWVHVNKTKLNVPMICSIGAVFDFYAGTVKRSGKFWINLGLEWLPRLVKEPRRLWKRNFVSMPLFLLILFYTKAKIVVKKIFRMQQKEG